MEEDKTAETTEPSASESKAANTNEGSMYVAVIGQDGKVHEVTPISQEALSIVQRTLKNLAVPVQPKRSPRMTPFPAVTSDHATPLPATDSFLVLSGSFGPNVTAQPSLWLEGEGFDLMTPVGKLRVQGQTIGENSSLQHYVTEELGPEGFKETACLLDVYDLLVGGVDQTRNIEVTAKQVLQRMGKGEHADDNHLQAHLVATVLYLARTLVIGLSPQQTRISPLLVLESVTTDQFGTIHLKYHLGEETFESIYGSKPLLYPLPTTRIVGYHGDRSHYEILLYAFLGNRLAQGKNYSLYFTTLCTHSGLLTREKLLPAQKNRMRDARQVIAALIQLERDNFIRCAPHPDLDLVIAVNVCLDPSQREPLSPQTMERIQPFLRSLEGYKTAELHTKRRIALQRLLDVEASQEERVKENPEFCTRLTIFPGDQLLAKQKQLLAKQKEPGMFESGPMLKN